MIEVTPRRRKASALCGISGAINATGAAMVHTLPHIALGAIIVGTTTLIIGLRELVLARKEEKAL